MNATTAQMTDAQAGSAECPVAPSDSLPHEQYRVLVANSRPLRARAWKLVYDIYRAMGYEPERESRMRIIRQDALPETTTFLVEACPRIERPLATLTLVPDSPLGIPMDGDCRAELNALREDGRRVCEVAKLAVSERCATLAGLDRMILLPLFRLAWLKASRLFGATDLLISVVPRHARFYEKVLLFERIGDVRHYGSVGGTCGVPLRLDLTAAEERYIRKYDSRSGGRNLYRLFASGDGPAILEWMNAAHAPMTGEDLRYFFTEQSDRLADLTASERLYLRRRYPGCDFDGLFANDTSGGTCQSAREDSPWTTDSTKPQLCGILAC